MIFSAKHIFFAFLCAFEIWYFFVTEGIPMKLLAAFLAFLAFCVCVSAGREAELLEWEKRNESS